MRKALVLLFVFGIAAVSCSQKTFEIQSAGSKRFAGGTKLSPTGTVYTIEMKALESSGNIKIDSIVANQRCFTEFSVFVKGSAPGSSSVFHKGDIIVLTFTHSKSPIIGDGVPPKTKENEFEESGKPSTVNLNGAAAVLFGTVKGKLFTISVPAFKVLPPDLRP